MVALPPAEELCGDGRNQYLERIVREGRVSAATVLFEMIAHGDLGLENKPTYAPPYELHPSPSELDLLDALIELIGKDCSFARAPVIPELKNKRWAARMCALHCLSALGVIDESVAGSVGARLEDDQEAVRSWAVAALESAGAYGVRYLIRAAEKGDSWIQRRALEALGELGPTAQEATRVLQHLSENRDVAIRTAAESALWSVEGNRDRSFMLLHIDTGNGLLDRPAAIQYLVRELERYSRAHEEYAVSSLVSVGEEVIPALSGLLRHPRACVRRDAIPAVLVVEGPVWRTVDAENSRTLLRLDPSSPLISGLLRPESAVAVRGGSVLVRVRAGKQGGEWILFGFSPTFRGWASGSVRLLENAIRAPFSD